MRFTRLAICLALTGLGFVSTGFAQQLTDPVPIVELVYVETNIDASAGGHLALRIEHQVYHYQAVENRLLLVREPWSHFQHYYQLLENRGLRLARLDLDVTQQQEVESYFNRQLIVQQRHLLTERLLLRQTARYPLGAIPAAETELPGLGYFQAISTEGVKPPYSRDLSAQLSVVRSDLAGLDPLPVDAQPQISGGQMITALATALEQREDLLLRHAALVVMQSGAGLSVENLIYLEQATLLERERRLLSAYQRQLERTTERLLNVDGPGGGYSLLVSHARLLAVRESLQRGHWVFLNSFPEAQQSNPGAPSARQAEVWRQLRVEVVQAWQAIRLGDTAAKELDGRAYARLETGASRMHAALIDSASFSDKTAWLPGLLMPQRMAALGVEPVVEGVPPAALADLAARFSEALSRSYDYRLFSRNCVTELVQALNQGAAADGEVEAALGSHMEAASGLNFIPRVFFDKAVQELKVSGVRYQPSRREQAIAGMQGDRPAWEIDLRESNTWTSHAYSGALQDDAFLFFTNGAVWLRPLQGIANIGYAAVVGGMGLFSAPFDGGERMTDGLRGMFYSAPELVGINLRKGQYDTLLAD